MADKDAAEILEVLEPALDEVVVTRTTSPRAMSPRKLGEIAVEIFGEHRVTVVDELPDALDKAAGLADEGGGVSGGVLATGSVVDRRRGPDAARHDERLTCRTAGGHGPDLRSSPGAAPQV